MRGIQKKQRQLKQRWLHDLNFSDAVAVVVRAICNRAHTEKNKIQREIIFTKTKAKYFLGN